MATAIQDGVVPPIDCIVCSPLHRALQSAKPFREAFPKAHFIVVDFSRELPGRNRGAMNSTKVEGFTRLRGAESTEGDNDAQFVEMDDAFVKDTWLRTSESQRRRNAVDKTVTAACDDFVINLGLGISDRKRKTGGVGTLALTTGSACILQVGHSGMFRCSHNMKTPDQMPAHKDLFWYGEQRAYSTEVT